MEILVIIALSVFIVFNIFVINALSSLIKLMKRGYQAVNKVSEQARGTLKQLNGEIEHVKLKVDDSFGSIDSTLANSNKYLAELSALTVNANSFLEKSNETIVIFNQKIGILDEIKPEIYKSTEVFNLTCLEFISTLRKIDYSIESFTVKYSPLAKTVTNIYSNYYKPAKKIYSMLNLVKKGIKFFKKK